MTSAARSPSSVSAGTRSWTSGGARLYGASPIGTGRNCSGNGAYLSPLPLLSLARALFHQPSGVRDPPRGPAANRILIAPTRVIEMEETHTERRNSPRRLIRFERITQPNDDNRTTPHRHRHHTAPRRAARPAGRARRALPFPTAALCRTTIRERDWLPRTTRAPRFLSVGIDVFFSPQPGIAARFVPYYRCGNRRRFGFALDRNGIV